MLKYSKKFLSLLLSIPSLYTMQKDIPFSNYSQEATAQLSDLITTKKDTSLQENDWEKIKEYLSRGANPNITIGTANNPLFLLAINDQRRSLFPLFLQYGADPNVCNLYNETPLHVMIVKCKNDHKAVEDLLKNGANPNAIARNHLTPLCLAVDSTENLNIINLLIQFNADVNYKSPVLPGKFQSFQSPLARAISINKPDIIKTLCNAGAWLINVDDLNNNAFHLLIDKPLENIKTVMRHAHWKQHNQKEVTKKVKLALLVFYRLNIHQDIQFLILSKLLSIDCFHKGLYNELLKRKYNQLPLSLIMSHIKYLQKILKIKNNKNKTAFQTMLRKNYDMLQTTNIGKLLDGSKLQEDLEIFNQNYLNISSIPKDNLALQIHNLHYALKNVN